MQQVLGPEQLREQQRGGRQKQKSYLQAQDRQFVEKDEWVWRKKGEETGDLGKDKMGQEGQGGVEGWRSNCYQRQTEGGSTTRREPGVRHWEPS